MLVVALQWLTKRRNSAVLWQLDIFASPSQRHRVAP
jgi:hypothetical protein